MAARGKRCITAEDLYRFQLIADCQISPDGRHVVYCVQRVDQETEKKYTNLWIVSTDGGHPRLTATRRTASPGGPPMAAR